MTDLHAQFDALKAIITHMTNKETKKDEVPAELWTAAGVKPGTRLKDIEKKVTELKKRVGAMKKEDVIADELGEELFARYQKSGKSLADFKRDLAAEAAAADGKSMDDEGSLKPDDSRAKERAIDDKTREARTKKVAGRLRSDDYDEGQVEGLWEGKDNAGI